MSTLTIKRGDTWAQRFEWVDNGTPVDLTGCTANMQLRINTESEVVLDLSSTTGGLTIDEANGYIYLRVEAAQTSQLFPITYVADIQVTFPDGTVQSTSNFSLVVTPDVTRE